MVFSPLTELDKESVRTSLETKLIGQVELVLQGLKRLKPSVSFTLTTGILNQDPIANGSMAALVNSGIEGFVWAAALDVPGRQRINVVSPALLTEFKEKYAGLFPGHETVSGTRVALAYRKSIAGIINGKVIQVGF